MTTSKVDHRQGLTTYESNMDGEGFTDRLTYITSTHTIVKEIWHNDDLGPWTYSESTLNHANGRLRHRTVVASRPWAVTTRSEWRLLARASEIEWVGEATHEHWHTTPPSEIGQEA